MSLVSLSGPNQDSSLAPPSSTATATATAPLQQEEGLYLTDREFSRLMVDIGQGLRADDDWKARIHALQKLQQISRGNGKEMDGFVSQVKGIQELIAAQVTDLRSVLSKEACKTVAIMAWALRSQFAPLAELWWPSLLKLVVVKIQVISLSADKAIRCLLASSSGADSKLLNLVTDSCHSKNSSLRKFSFEYLAMVCAMWRAEFLDRHAPLLKGK